MNRFIRAALLAACLLAAAAPLAHAGPSRMSYQGVLTDGGGNLVPDGNYNLTFRIYDAPVAGTLYWTEALLGVPVVKGGFSVVLGSSTPVNVPFESFAVYYLGVQVGANPELTPRVQLSGSPSAMSLGMTGDNGFLAGEMNWFASASGLGTGGGFLHLYGLSGPGGLNLEPDFSGTGLWGYFTGYGNSYFNWDGDRGGAEGTLVVSGLSTTSFNTAQSGDGAVQLPSDAVSSGEVLDEPGIAQGHVFYSVNIPATTTDLVTVSLTTPAAGYIVVEADAQHGIGGDGVTTVYAQLQIAETPGVGFDHEFISGFSPSLNTFIWSPISIRRTYYKPAGSYTFRLEGMSVGGLSNYLWNPTITATYYPTSYGTVTEVANEPELAQFSQVTRTTPGSIRTQPGTAAAGATVDLRELELRVRREETRLAESRLQLQVARMQEQQQASARATAARRDGAVAPAPKEER